MIFGCLVGRNCNACVADRAKFWEEGGVTKKERRKAMRHPHGLSPLIPLRGLFLLRTSAIQVNLSEFSSLSLGKD